jgi:hypothetical protein
MRLKNLLTAFLLLMVVFLQGCSGHLDQLTTQGRELTINTSEQADKLVISKRIVTSGDYLASFYKGKGELKADLRADEKQKEPNYRGLPVIVETGINLDTLSRLSPKIQQNRIQFGRNKDGKVDRLVVFKGGVSGGMECDDEDDEGYDKNYVKHEKIDALSLILEDKAKSNDEAQYEPSLPIAEITLFQSICRGYLVRRQYRLTMALRNPANLAPSKFRFDRASGMLGVNVVFNHAMVNAIKYRFDTATKNYTSYGRYDQYGCLVQRVDVTGKSHYNGHDYVPTPHVEEYKIEIRNTPRGQFAQYSTCPVRRADWWELPF